MRHAAVDLPGRVDRERARPRAVLERDLALRGKLRGDGPHGDDPAHGAPLLLHHERASHAEVGLLEEPARHAVGERVVDGALRLVVERAVEVPLQRLEGLLRGAIVDRVGGARAEGEVRRSGGPHHEHDRGREEAAAERDARPTPRHGRRAEGHREHGDRKRRPCRDERPRHRRLGHRGEPRRDPSIGPMPGVPGLVARQLEERAKPTRRPLGRDHDRRLRRQDREEVRRVGRPHDRDRARPLRGGRQRIRELPRDLPQAAPAAQGKEREQHGIGVVDRKLAQDGRDGRAIDHDGQLGAAVRLDPRRDRRELGRVDPLRVLPRNLHHPVQEDEVHRDLRHELRGLEPVPQVHMRAVLRVARDCMNRLGFGCDGRRAHRDRG